MLFRRADSFSWSGFKHSAVSPITTPQLTHTSWPSRFFAIGFETCGAAGPSRLYAPGMEVPFQEEAGTLKVTAARATEKTVM